eukprot:GSChrysophyteH1.ASY1.ANO1.3300.1 assembled CDS
MLRTLGTVLNPRRLSEVMGTLWSRKYSAEEVAVNMNEALQRCEEYRAPKNGGHDKDRDKISVASFNLLAPCYRRLKGQRNSMGRTLRESHNEGAWVDRANETLTFLETHLLAEGQPHSLVALQEFWLEPSYHGKFAKLFTDSGYKFYTLKRGGKKKDALALLYRENEFSLRGTREACLVADDRVALFLHLKHMSTGRDVIMANTHLTFPHSVTDRQLQIRQVNTLHAELGSFLEDEGLDAETICIITGDFNVEDKSAVCQHLRSQGFVAAFDVEGPANGSNGSNGAASTDSWVSHKTHLGEELGVDHIFVRCANAIDVPPSPVGEIAETGEKEKLLFIDDSAVVPKQIPCDSWNEGFTVSDHRPVSCTLHVRK